MKTLHAVLISLALFVMAFSQAAPQSAAKSDWADWDFLLGEWTAAESSGGPGSASAGGFMLAPDLGGKILLRKNHAEYPPANGHAAIIHDDLMIVYREGGTTKAFYTDNEGHVIRYHASASADKKRITLLSEKTAGSPRYRLIYENLQTGLVKLSFEIAPPDKPEEFKKYVEAVVKRKQ
ncbi:MAG TPA: hypothetical protein VH724_19620 [Candidatus Angelobacter sp.]|nr:hypothetical protein [Candidatus Angelobacter sp.]